MGIPAEREEAVSAPALIFWPPGIPGALIVSLRPHQWLKNLLLFGGLIFSRSLFDLNAVAVCTAAFAAFCLVSSGGYLLNDLCDIANDRRHPVKRFRPIASGELRPGVVGLAIVVLLTAAMLIGVGVGSGFTAVLTGYAALSFSYSLAIKRFVVLDVVVLALGFVLRMVAGAVAIQVEASPWLALCTLLLALFVALGKRRHELTILQSEAGAHRASLEGYSERMLAWMMGLAGVAAILAYTLYTTADATQLRFGGWQLALTIPCVICGVFRYLLLVQNRQENGDPANLLITDLPSVLNAILWGVLVCILIYAPVVRLGE